MENRVVTMGRCKHIDGPLKKGKRYPKNSLRWLFDDVYLWMSWVLHRNTKWKPWSFNIYLWSQCNNADVSICNLSQWSNKVMRHDLKSPDDVQVMIIKRSRDSITPLLRHFRCPMMTSWFCQHGCCPNVFHLIMETQDNLRNLPVLPDDAGIPSKDCYWFPEG